MPCRSGVAITLRGEEGATPTAMAAPASSAAAPRGTTGYPASSAPRRSAKNRRAAACTLALPWGYVLKQYVQAPGDRWGKRVPSSTPGRDIGAHSSAGSLADAGAIDG